MSQPKFSIIIPTWNHLEDCLKPCIESIKKYTSLDNVEVIIVAQVTDVSQKQDYIEYLSSLTEVPINHSDYKYEQCVGPFKVLWFETPLGFAIATNAGLARAKGHYIVLLNNDARFLQEKKNEWLNMLVKPFNDDPKTGITGPFVKYEPAINSEFVLFFCAMFKMSLYQKLGNLDPTFEVGGCEDMDYCMKAKALGLKLVEVPVGVKVTHHPTEKFITGGFPISHEGGITVHGIPGFDNIFNRNLAIVHDRYTVVHDIVTPTPKPKLISSVIPKPVTKPIASAPPVREAGRILCSISTKERYDILPLAIMSVALQTRKPNKLLIFDDTDEKIRKNLNEDEIFKALFVTLYTMGVEVFIANGAGKGQHHNHELANIEPGFDFVWRLDDDEVAEPNVLEKLMKHFYVYDDATQTFKIDAKVGAVGGAVFTPGQIGAGGTGKMKDIYHTNNIQWCPQENQNKQQVFEVEHLYSSFVYRSRINHYNLQLSPVAHREETIFSNGIFQKGYKLLVDLSAKTYHYRQAKGGIRSNHSTDGRITQFMYDHDEAIFAKQMESQGIKLIKLETGLGDHIAFSSLIPKLLEKYPHLILGCCFNEVFKPWPQITLTSVGAAQQWNHDNVYTWMGEHNWKGTLIGAFGAMYDIDISNLGII